MTDTPQTVTHTPGEWTVSGWSIHSANPEDDRRGDCVAVICTGAENSWTDVANARLIAAAPVLLAALKAALRSQEFEWRYHARIGRRPALNLDMNRLVSDIAVTKAAIAKAEENLDPDPDIGSIEVGKVRHRNEEGA